LSDIWCTWSTSKRILESASKFVDWKSSIKVPISDLGINFFYPYSCFVWLQLNGNLSVAKYYSVEHETPYWSNISILLNIKCDLYSSFLRISRKDLSPYISSMHTNFSLWYTKMNRVGLSFQKFSRTVTNIFLHSTISNLSIIQTFFLLFRKM
jgi:hypothetical protein